MDIKDIAGKAEELLHGHEEQVDEAIEKAADIVEQRTPDQVDSLVEKGAEQAKKLT
jgi:hypothetical protein